MNQSRMFLLWVFLVSLVFSTPSFSHSGGQLLGHGYDEEKGQYLGAVVEAENGIEYSGTQRSRIDTITDISFDQLLTELGVKTSAGFSIGIFDIKGGIDFASNIAKDELSMNISYIFEITGKEASLNGLRYTPKAKKILESANPEKKRKFFGHKFVNSVSLGGKLIASVAITFNNRESKNEFKGAFDMSIPMFLKMHAEGGAKYNQFRKHASIKVSALQIGGDPSQLANILLQSNDNRAPIIECSFANLKPCQETFAAIINYGKNFGTQIDPKYDPSSPIGSAYSVGDLARYSESGLAEVDETMSVSELSEVIYQRESLIKRHLYYMKDRTKIDQLLGLEPPKHEHKRLSDLRLTVEELINKTIKVINTCHQSPGLCLDTVAKLDEEKLSYNHDDISFEWSFLNYCEYSREDVRISNTIQRIRKSIQDAEHMNCRELEETLLEMPALDLSFQLDQGLARISDLRPLAGLINLKKLNLTNQAISSLKPLARSCNLRTLIAPGNSLMKLPDLSNFPDLRILDLSFNRNMFIESCYDMKSFEKSKNLRFVSVREAQFEENQRDSFVAAMKFIGLEWYVNLFTSNEDVCEKRRVDALKTGDLSEKQYLFYKEEKLCPAELNIFIPSSDVLALDY